MSNNTINADYWNDLYKRQETGWDVGFPSPAIQEYIDQLTNKEGAILIPGCGNAYEADYLIGQGFTNITLIDISPALTAQLEDKFREHLGKTVNVITGNFFDQDGKYDLILEQTFLSALDPSLRPAYADKMYNLLNTGGHLAGVLFSKSFEESPPYGGSEEEYQELFSKNFIIKTLAPCYNSIERRKGAEVFINLIKK